MSQNDEMREEDEDMEKGAPSSGVAAEAVEATATEDEDSPTIEVDMEVDDEVDMERGAAVTAKSSLVAADRYSRNRQGPGFAPSSSVTIPSRKGSGGALARAGMAAAKI